MTIGDGAVHRRPRGLRRTGAHRRLGAGGRRCGRDPRRARTTRSWPACPPARSAGSAAPGPGSRSSPTARWSTPAPAPSTTSSTDNSRREKSDAARVHPRRPSRSSATRSARRSTPCWRSGMVAQGPEVAAFEQEFGDQLVDGRTCVAVNSGTSGLHLGLLAAGIGPGDEVIVPSFTFAATANSVALTGATPVFVDIEPDVLLPRPARGRGRDHRAHPGDHARPPLRPPRRHDRARRDRRAARR